MGTTTDTRCQEKALTAGVPSTLDALSRERRGAGRDRPALRHRGEPKETPLRIIANHPGERNPREYLLKEREEREVNGIPPGERVLFLEVTVTDASEFASTLQVRGETVGAHRVLRAEGASVPNAIAAILLRLRDTTGHRPHVYFARTEGNPLKFLAKYILFGEGDIAPVTHELLQQAEPAPAPSWHPHGVTV